MKRCCQEGQSGRSEEQTDKLCMKTSTKQDPPKTGPCGMDDLQNP